MPQYDVIIQPEAELDLDEAFAYFEAQQSGLGFTLLADLTETLELMEENPFLFQKVYGEIPRAVVQRFGYNLLSTLPEKGLDYPQITDPANQELSFDNYLFFQVIKVLCLAL